MMKVAAIKVLIMLALVICLAGILRGQSKADSQQKWYQFTSGKNMEKGQVTEFQDKHRIYISYLLYGWTAEHQAYSVKKSVLSELAKYKGLEVVDNPNEAEGAIFIFLSDEPAPEQAYGTMTSPGDANPLRVRFYVLIRGAKNDDSTFKSRILWEKSSGGQGVAAATVSNHVRSFIKTLKKMRNEP